VLLLAGCTHLGNRITRADLAPGAPSVETILNDLAANDAAIKNFKATGTFRLKSPDLVATQLLRESAIYFRRPMDLYVVGRKYATQVFRLTCVGPKFLVELPTEKQYYFRPEGEKVNKLGLKTVSPSDIAREMFLPEVWTEISAKNVRMAAYDESRHTANLEILTGAIRKRVHRRLLVEGAPWVVRRSELLDRHDRIIAVTTKDDYHEQDGVRFPAKVASVFPSEDAEMSFDMRKYFINTDQGDISFEIDTRVPELQSKGYQEMQPREGKEPTP
jgi:hypothetical protein